MRHCMHGCAGGAGCVGTHDGRLWDPKLRPQLGHKLDAYLHLVGIVHLGARCHDEMTLMHADVCLYVAQPF